jgi:hypothetical protein
LPVAAEPLAWGLEQQLLVLRLPCLQGEGFPKLHEELQDTNTSMLATIQATRVGLAPQAHVIKTSKKLAANIGVMLCSV